MKAGSSPNSETTLRAGERGRETLGLPSLAGEGSSLLETLAPLVLSLSNSQSSLLSPSSVCISDMTTGGC